MRDFIRGNASDVQIIVDKLLSELLNLDNQNTLTSSVSLSMPTTAPTPVKNPTIQNPTPSPSPYPISNGSFILNLVTIVVSITVLLFLVILVLYQKFKPETRDVGLKIGLLGVLRQEGTEKERLIKKQ